MIPPWTTKKQLIQKVKYQQFPSDGQRNEPKITNIKAKFRLVKALPRVREKEPSAVSWLFQTPRSASWHLLEEASISKMVAFFLLLH